MAGLTTYHTKRRFGVTQEPRGKVARGKGHAFVIQKHDARRLHYDLRLELDGVMKSWAVTRGPSLVPGEKRLAVQVEDHPIAYNKFEGTIPKGEYGGGTVMIWDRGQWQPEDDPHKGLAKGHLSFQLAGKKLHGGWHLVRMHRRPGEKRDNWLLIKQHDADARSKRDQDILDQAPLSVASGRSLKEIAEGAPRRKRGARKKPTTKRATGAKKKATKKGKARKNTKRAARTRAAANQSATKRSAPVKSRASATVGKVTLTHPDRVYWDDVGVTKQDLADYYGKVWKWMRPHVVGRPLALVRCPDGAGGQCFFQKHAHTGIPTEFLHLVPEKGDKIISIDNLNGLIALVQGGALEIHVRGAPIDDRERADRLVFDLDPGPGLGWDDVVEAAREVRARLRQVKLKSFVKTTGGKGLHVVVPIRPEPWDTAKEFAHAVAQSMAKDDPKRYLATATKAQRKNHLFVDYLRNTREATAVAPYSSRARAGAPVAMPIAWSELGNLTSAHQYTVQNAMQRLGRLKSDPWADIGRVRQALPNFK